MADHPLCGAKHPSLKFRDTGQPVTCTRYPHKGDNPDDDRGPHARPCTLEWETTPDGRVKTSGVVNGRMEELYDDRPLQVLPDGAVAPITDGEG